MEDSSRDDIRKLLKTFGIQADEAVVAHLTTAMYHLGSCCV